MACVAARDWVEWHDEYDEPDSYLTRRLGHVQRRIRDVLDTAPPGPFRVISMCAGQGRDLLGVLVDHPRREDVHARLVELDEHNAAYATATARDAQLQSVEVVVGDASLTAAYTGIAPADLVLACGIFGNITDDDIRNTIRALPRFCRVDATVIWTRHRKEPDLTPTIREWFGDAGFDEVAFDIDEGLHFSVGTHRFVGTPVRFDPNLQLFTFV